MAGMRSQPRGMARVRREYAGRGVGVIFSSDTVEVFGGGPGPVPYNNPTRVVAPGSVLARKLVAAQSQHLQLTPPPGIVDFSLAEPYTVICVFTLDSLATTTRILSYRGVDGGPAGLTGMQLAFVSGTPRLAYLHGTSTGEAAKVRGNENLEVGKQYRVTCGWDGSAYFMYINGVKQNGATVGSIVTSNTGTNTDIYIGRRNTGGSFLDGQVAMFAHIKGQVDALALSVNPWQILDELREDQDISSATATPVSHAAVIAASNQASTSAGVTVKQRQKASIAASSQAGTCGAVSAVQRHKAVAASSTGSATSPGVAVKQRHKAIAAASAQANTAPSLAAKQRHKAAVATSTQAGTSPALSVGQQAQPGAAIIAPSTQDGTSPSIIARQRQKVAASASSVAGTSPAIVVRQRQSLAISASAQNNNSPALLARARHRLTIVAANQLNYSPSVHFSEAGYVYRADPRRVLTLGLETRVLALGLNDRRLILGRDDRILNTQGG